MYAVASGTGVVSEVTYIYVYIYYGEIGYHAGVIVTVV